MLQTTSATIATLRTKMPVAPSASEALDRMGRSVELARYLGISAEALADIAADDYDRLDRAADAVVGAFRARCDRANATRCATT